MGVAEPKMLGTTGVVPMEAEIQQRHMAGIGTYIPVASS